MNFELDPAQKAMQFQVRQWAERSYRFADRQALLEEPDAGQRTWQAYAENGWLGTALPEVHGGRGGGAIDTALIAQEFGRALVVEPYLGCAVMAVQTLIAAASPQQLDRLLPDMASGRSKIALAYSEAQSRGMPEPITLRAERVPDGYALNGCKTVVLGGVGADRFIVSAVMRAQPILLLIEAASSGLTIDALKLHDGSQAAQLTFDGVFVPSEALLGKPANALGALRLGLAHGTAALCAELVGAMERVIEITADYLKTRVQFGVPIGSFQALQHRLADMAAEMELSRS